MEAEIQQYVTHAKKFGSDGVMETARDAGLNLKQLEGLMLEVDKIDAANIRRNYRFAKPTKHRLTVEQRVKRLCGITDEEGE